MTEQFKINTDYTITKVYRIRGTIVHGFKRGSTQLGFPTANVDPAAFAPLMQDAPHGVYFGWAQVLPHTTTAQNNTDNATQIEDKEVLHCDDYGVFKCMLSLGKNVQFDAENDTLEAYIHHKFKNNFYGHTIELIVCAYIRPQLSFDSLDALIKAIQRDVDVGDFALEHHAELRDLSTDTFFTTVDCQKQKASSL